jgi:hypothetical protein
VRSVLSKVPPPKAMSTTDLLVAEPRNFCLKWRHQDGSTIEFNSSGWLSDDPLKADWLSKMNELCSSKPTICPMVHFWLREYCELIDFRWSERTEPNHPRVPAHSFPRSGSAHFGFSGRGVAAARHVINGLILFIPWKRRQPSNNFARLHRM